MGKREISHCYVCLAEGMNNVWPWRWRKKKTVHRSENVFSMWQEMFEQMDEDGDGEVTRHLDQGNVMEMTNTSLDD